MKEKGHRHFVVRALLLAAVCQPGRAETLVSKKESVQIESQKTEAPKKADTAIEPAGSTQIGSRPPTRPSPPPDWKPPLDGRVNMRLLKAPLQSFYEAIARQSKIHFIVEPGFEHCTVTAFVHNLTVREALQLALSIKGMTYQQSGRSDTYVIVPRKDSVVCPRREPAVKAAGSCTALRLKPVSLECKDGPVSSFVELVFEESRLSFFFGDGAEDYPVTARFAGLKPESALKNIIEDKSLDVRKIGDNKAFVISIKEP